MNAPRTKHRRTYDAGIDIGRQNRILVDYEFQYDPTGDRIEGWVFHADEGGYEIDRLKEIAREHARSCPGC